MMKVFARNFGGDSGKGGTRLVVLHGLLGSSRNWQSVAAALAADFPVSALDLRNHGQSPHASEHSYEAMVDDVAAWLDENHVAQVNLLGHSMGGKVAMALACRRPERVLALGVVDIAPRDYALDHHRPHFAAMNALDLDTVSSRAEAERQLATGGADAATARFLATNLERGEDGRLRWRINLPVLTKSLEEMGRTPLVADERFEGPALFIVGGHSRYVTPGDHALIRRHFPAARIEVLPEAGHNPHIDSPAELVAQVRELVMRG
jgi:esterase